MYFVIGLCIGFIVGNAVGVILMAIMASASRDSREREYISLSVELDKLYIGLNDHMLAISPDETTADSEYQFRKGQAVGIQQCLNSLAEIMKGE